MLFLSFKDKTPNNRKHKRIFTKYYEPNIDAIVKKYGKNSKK